MFLGRGGMIAGGYSVCPRSGVPAQESGVTPGAAALIAGGYLLFPAQESGVTPSVPAQESGVTPSVPAQES